MGIIFLILAVIYMVRRPKLKALHPGYFPHVHPEDFERWRRQEILSIDIFLGSCLFSAVMTTILPIMGAVMSQSPGFTESPLRYLAVGGMAVGIVGFFVGLIVSAIFGSMAASLKKKLGIEVPK